MLLKLLLPHLPWTNELIAKMMVEVIWKWYLSGDDMNTNYKIQISCSRLYGTRLLFFEGLQFSSPTPEVAHNEGISILVTYIYIHVHYIMFITPTRRASSRKHSDVLFVRYHTRAETKWPKISQTTFSNAFSWKTFVHFGWNTDVFSAYINASLVLGELTSKWAWACFPLNTVLQIFILNLFRSKAIDNFIEWHFGTNFNIQCCKSDYNLRLIYI